MDNPAFEDGENIPIMDGDGDGWGDDGDGDIPHTPTGEGGSMPETPFPTPAVPEETPGSKVTPLSNELKIQQIQALYDFWNVKGNVNWVELDRFRLHRNDKTGNIELKFMDGDDWISLTNSRNGKFLAKSTVSSRMKGGGRGGGVEAMKNMLGLDETPLQSERSKTAARKLAKTIPTNI